MSYSIESLDFYLNGNLGRQNDNTKMGFLLFSIIFVNIEVRS